MHFDVGPGIHEILSAEGYIIEQALGGTLKDRFEQLQQRHQESARGTARQTLADPAVYALETLKKPQRAALVEFWEAWQDELTSIRLLDPTCGSGAFLIEAFDQMYAEYRQSNERLTEIAVGRSRRGTSCRARCGAACCKRSVKMLRERRGVG